MSRIFLHDRSTGDRTHQPEFDGCAGQCRSKYPSVSIVGRFVGFGNDASNLVANDTNGFTDVFIRDRPGSTAECASVAQAQFKANDWSDGPSLSADGHYLGFSSEDCQQPCAQGHERAVGFRLFATS
ncbi:MAG: hypothetical protein IPJ19_21450 [Planctomycetes bacterium]|nr:hypothetical protein [Planctomycetota bacterium]